MAERPTDDRPPPAGSHFPYAFTPVAGKPWYARYHAEGLSPLHCALHGIHYYLKYRRKWRRAPEEELAYFRRQHQLLAWLAGQPPAPGDVGLALVGDLMWIADGWAGFLSDEVLDHVNGHEAVLGNLETAISGSFRVSRPFPEFAWFNADPALVTSFRRPDGTSTFSALGVANNHCLDYRDRGARDTLGFLDDCGIGHSGIRERADGRPYAAFEAGGIRIGFYSACWGLNDRKRVERSELTVEIVEGLASDGPSAPDLSGVRAALAAMEAEGVELKVVHLHWGYEYELYPRPRQMQAAREIVRAGADVLFGSHPHVQQPAEVCFLNGYERRYADAASGLPPGSLLDDGAGRPRKALVCYSLGNFATAMVTFLCRVGLVESLRLRRDPDTGRLDWHCPRGQLAYNVPKHDGRGQRRLVLLRSWLRDHQPEAAGELAGLLDRIVAEP